MNKKIISCAIAALMVLGAMPIDAISVTNDDISTESFTNELSKLKNGRYSINLKALKTDGSGAESMSKQYLENPGNLYVENGSIKLEIKFNNSNYMSNHSVTVNGQDAEEFEKEELDGNIVKLAFNIKSLDDEIIVGAKVMGFMDVTLQVSLLSDTLTDEDGNLVDLDSIVTDDNSSLEEKDDLEDGGNSSVNENDNNIEQNIWKDGTYTIKNEILKSDLSGISHAKGFVEEYSDIKVIDGKKYVLLKFKAGTSMITDLNIYSKNGELITYEEMKKDEDTYHVKFLIDSLDDDITINIGVSVAQHTANYDFILRFDQSTLKSSDDSKENSSDSNKENSSDKIDNNIKPDDDNKSEPIINPGIELTKDARYSIQNDVLNINNDNLALAGNYVDKESIVEVEDKKIYLTLKFKDKNILNNNTLTVNGNATRFNVINNEGNNLYIRFQVSSLNDKIVILNKDNEIDGNSFRIVLNNNTIKEYIAESESVTTEGSSEVEIDENVEEDDDLEKGTYSIKNNALKEDSNSESMARDYLNKTSVLDVKSNGKMYLTLKFTKGTLMSNVRIKVNGKNVSYTVVKESGDNYHIKFKISSLSDEILVSSTIMNSMDVKFRVLLRSSTLESNEEDDENDDEIQIDEKEEEVIEDNKLVDLNNSSNETIYNGMLNTNTSENNNITYKRETYSVKNDIVTSSSVGYQAARNAISEISYLEIENGVNYITVGISQTNLMNNIRLSINGENVSYEIVNQDKNNNTMSIRFKIPTLGTQVNVTTNISAMGRDTSFGLKFLESSLKHISSEEGSLPISSGATSSLVNNLIAETTSLKPSGSSSVSKLSSTSTKDEDISEEALENSSLKAKEYFKKYSITNEIISDSSMGKMMARKYLNENSIVEDIDGKLYVTLTFSGTQSMDNFRFTVNGEDVDYSIVSDEPDTGIKSFRFIISSVNDSIQAYIYVKPMNMDIDFGIKLNEDSMILIDEGVVSEDGELDNNELILDDMLNNNKNNSNNKQSQFDTVKTAVSASGLTLIANYLISGAVGIIKRKKLLNSSKVD